MKNLKAPKRATFQAGAPLLALRGTEQELYACLPHPNGRRVWFLTTAQRTYAFHSIHTARLIGSIYGGYIE